MFDTIHLTVPLPCPTCRVEVRSLQTKEFDCIMAHYKIGSLVAASPVLTGTRAANSEPEATDTTTERRRAFQRFFDLPEEILTAPDPLAAILAANKHADEEAED